MRALAVFLPNWIGDVVMATPAVRALRLSYPRARFVAVGKPYVADTLAGLTWFDETIAFDKRTKSAGFWRAALGLRRAGADSAVLFPNSFRAALLARAGGCTTVAGVSRYGRHLLLSERLTPKRGPGGRYEPTPVIDDYNRLAVALGTADPGHRMELATTPADELAADAAWRELGLGRARRVVGFNPGGAFGAAKHWPVAHFAELAQTLTRQPNTAVVVLAGPAEIAEANAIVATANRPAVVTVANRPLSVGLTKALVRRLDLLVTTDSGPRHFAAAFGVPVVTLFGPTHIGWTETYFAGATHLQLGLPCGPCQQRTCPLGHHRCMAELTPQSVAEVAGRLLGAASEGERRRAG